MIYLNLLKMTAKMSKTRIVMMEMVITRFVAILYEVSRVSVRVRQGTSGAKMEKRRINSSGFAGDNLHKYRGSKCGWDREATVTSGIVMKLVFLGPISGHSAAFQQTAPQGGFTPAYP